MKNESLSLRRARVVLPQRVAENQTVLIEDGRIAGVGEEQAFEPDSSSVTLDLTGLKLFPGLIDVHIHGATGVDTMDASVDDLHHLALFLAASGVTGWLPTFVPAPDEDYGRAVQSIDQLMREQPARPAAARALGVHYEGPFVNHAQCGALRTEHFRTFTAISSLDSLLTLKAEDAKHMITLAPEIEGGISLVKELNERGWIVSIGHTRASVEVLDRAHQAGAHHLTHFMNAMVPLHHRAPGPIGWGLVRDDVTCDVIADGVHLDPKILQLVLRCKTSERIVLISDSGAPTGRGDGEYRIWGETIKVSEGRTQNARGSIAGSVITMHDAFSTMQKLGASDMELARMTATNPARLLGIEGDCGSIEEGKRADLVALDDSGKIRLTIVGGRVAFNTLGE